MGKLYLHFWVAKWILAAGLALLIVMKHIKAVICKRCVVMTQILPPSSAMMLQLLCKELGSAEPLWGPMYFWGGTLQNWPLLMSRPWKGCCGVGQQMGCSLGPVGACPTASPCMHPAASCGKWAEGINISTNFWMGGSWGQETVWASESSCQVQGRNTRQHVLRAFSCFQYFAAAKPLAFLWRKYSCTEWQKRQPYGDTGSDRPAGRRPVVMGRGNS